MEMLIQFYLFIKKIEKIFVPMSEIENVVFSLKIPTILYRYIRFI